ncbi:semaphorin-6C-like isoform X1 [Pygocentrus nattereri]|nr:semaphorin-6C-like isoform X1 [Pygocentrus nattereri]
MSTEVMCMGNFVMELIFIVSLLSIAGIAMSFPKDLQPITTVGLEDSQLFPSFQGLVSDNDTQTLGLDFQRMIRINYMLYVAARDHVFAVNLSASVTQIIPQQTLTWMSTDVEKCTMRGKNTDECYNYIKVLVLRNDETLFACGTNAFNPTCRNYRLSSLEQVGVELVGQARCPFESHQANVGIFAGGQFYSATMSDFQASDAVIYRSLGGEGSPVLRSIKYDSKWLREPQFVHAIEYGSYVYIFFSEIAVESMALGKVMYSRVARVCKNDSGGSARVLERYWTSFLKARLNCSVPGESIFYFDVLQSISNVIQINQRPAVVGVFTTQKNSIPGSAVCGFYMDEIERVFRGRFKEQKGTDSAWSAVPEEQVPKPRPGSCAGDGSASAFSSSVLFPDSMLSFIKAHPLMDECVSSINNQPFLTHTISGCRLTQIVVDTVAGPYKNCTVIFLGSEDGHVLKVLMNSDLNSSQTTTLLEDIHVYNPSKCNEDRRHLGLDRKVLGLEMDKEHHALFVAFSSCIIRVPLSRCTQQFRNCRSHCLSSHDPYCVWLQTGTCANVSPGFKGVFEQDITGDQSWVSDSCNNTFSEAGNRNSEMDSMFAPGVSVEERSSSSVHYKLLIMFVVVAFMCGAFLSAVMVFCYCGQQSQLAEASDLQAKLSLAKLSSLLEPQTHRASEQIYYSFLLKNKQHRVAAAHTAPPTVGHDHQHFHLPVPDSTPELIKETKAFCSQWEKNTNVSCSLEEKVPAQQVVPFTQSLTANQSAAQSLSNHQSVALSHSNNHSVSLSLSSDQSAYMSLSNNQSTSLSLSNNQSASQSLSNNCSVSLSLSSDQSASMSLSNNQSASQSLSNNHSMSLSLSSDQSASMSLSNNESATPIPSPSPMEWQCQSPMDMATQNEFLKYIHQKLGECSKRDRIAAVTSVLLPGATGSSHCGVKVDSYYSSSTLQQGHQLPVEQIRLFFQSELDSEKEQDRRSDGQADRKRDEKIKQESECTVWHPSQCLSLVKLESVAAVSRKHSFNPHRLVHISPSGNTSTKTNGQKSFGFDPGNRADGFDPGNRADGFDPGNRADGFDPGNRADGFDLGDRADGFDLGNRANGFDLGDRADGFDLGDRADGFDLGDRADGFDLNNIADRFNLSNRDAEFNRRNGADVFDHRLLRPGSSYLTRQHSYSEQPHTNTYTHRAAIIRRTASLKPRTPPKPHRSHSRPPPGGITCSLLPSS